MHMKPSSVFYLAIAVYILTCLSCNPPQQNASNRSLPTSSTANAQPRAQEPLTVPDSATHSTDTIIDLSMLEIPMMKGNSSYVSHTGFSYSYNEAHEQANWVAYELTAEELIGEAERSDNFKEDPTVTTGSASIADYRKSGYDRGHLAPAADMRWSETAMDESFYFSNMSPQVPSFNRGIWKKLEEQVREWAEENGAVYVITGGILEEWLPKIGENGVSVPNYYYKVVLDYREPDLKAIAFLMKNEGSKEPLSSFVVPINRIEELTGINFFHKLPDAIEEQLESTSDFSKWEPNE